MSDGRHLDSLSDETKRVPMQGLAPNGERRGVPEPIARLAYEQYSYEFGTSQSFERLHERGGFGATEALALLADLIERERAGRKS